MFKKTLLATVAVVAFAISPIVNTHITSTHAAVIPHDTTCPTGTPFAGQPTTTVTLGTFNGTAVTYDKGCYSGCPNAATLVGTYGSSALKGYITTEAPKYCTATGNTVDVEYSTLSGADSCPGVDYAADNSDGNEVGLSDVFPGGCPTQFLRPASAVTDKNDTVNVVETLMQCSGAQAPTADGYPGQPITTTASNCQGPGADALTTNSLHFCAPSDQAQLTAQNLWQDQIATWDQIGGTATCAIKTQNRQSGSGTRATWCLNIFEGVDHCQSNATAPDAPTTGTMLADVCGTSTAAPVDANGTIGYASRAGIAPVGKAPVTNCGIVPVGGNTGYNGACDPTAGSYTTVCAGDVQVQRGTYFVWGYEHFDLNPSSTLNSAAKAFVTYVETNATAQNDFIQNGFIKACRMLQARTVDAGTYTSSTPTC